MFEAFTMFFAYNGRLKCNNFFFILYSLGDREFIFLDEQLTKLILDLDKVQTDGLEDVRVARKSAVQRIQFLINTLESKD